MRDCENCGTSHDGSYGSGRFCESWCARSFVSLSRRTMKTPGTCLYCQKTPLRSGLQYCPDGHRGLFQRAELVKNWELGNVDGITHIRIIRRYLIERYGTRCWKCGWAEINPITGKVPVELNHIDGDWRNCVKENLEIICPNCHSLTPNFRALNRRPADRKAKGQRKIYAGVA